MGDVPEKKKETAVKNSSHGIVPPRNSDTNSEKKSETRFFSEEKLERLHESIAESKSSIEPLKNARKREENENREGKVVDKDRKSNVTEEGKNQERKRENASKVEKEKHQISDSVLCDTKQPGEKVSRNQSDIFSLKEIPTKFQTAIFSVNGCPSRRVFRKQEPAGHVFTSSWKSYYTRINEPSRKMDDKYVTLKRNAVLHQMGNDEPPAEKVTVTNDNRITKENYNDEKRPSSSYRNPLTGSGLSSNDEYKSKGTKRKDGNPLLGLGYESEVNAVTSQHRIPPGGYSHKLW